MSLSKQINARATKSNSKIPYFGVIRELMIWNNAWREYSRLQELDAKALRDMGLSDEARASVTVSQIASRMRG
ncbi:hypothetical protein J7394_21820 [Ruegeria sp. R13_0]|uniref:hypothetical protein n=1 Tax=Ruegeria sp. R13_0 TaxID=2821099 RepID=UPI001ADC9B98|nr:hypothetical protein [Ruegeria sp. R13_0]MBO9436853.1 hypothetical protein [Ruegeria sp. R13_0]